MKILQSEFQNPEYKEMIGFTRTSLRLPESASIELSSLEGRGSDRVFFRLEWNRKDSAILIHYDPRRVENTYYPDIAEFLHDIHVLVPRLIRHDPVKCLIVMEDLGDTDLWSLRKTSWEIRRFLYQKTLIIVHRLHSFPPNEFPSERVRLMEGFGLPLYRWEQNYFRDHLVRDVCGIKLEPFFEQELEVEMVTLREHLSVSKYCLIHRDLQSQNVMIRNDEPFLIDFQGMRSGNPLYELGSLLCDPYVDFSDRERNELLFFYYGLCERNVDWVTFQNIFWEASAQRLMQALGAYGFLGLKKGLKGFLEHIPAGLRHLHHATSQTPSLPRLSELSLLCQEEIEKKKR